MSQPKIGIIGIGNTILQDEGVGMHMAEYLEKNFSFNPTIDFHYIGTGGLALADITEPYDSIIILDTIVADNTPGTVITIDHETLLSPKQSKGNAGHAIGLKSGLEFAKLSGVLPKQLVLIAMVPEVISFGSFFSKSVKQALPSYEKIVLKELQCQGIECTPLLF